ncbi:MSHA biogenesis protein MshM [Pseudoalteromonas carrageenovora]|uniref:AAA family ATPase n=1 Tax=Pseudoalteromonas carrageenovora IAM 12662 TaxID=1314868 RepID=A0A2K4X5X3_PSEVC|nr:AAA family ATPase [Pseudoalteromonas carrageenovora]MBE0381871.1 MSHA biogenesis protein MshM [Pseudoalteromonas carrageenovora IAM 12662]QBJ70616.1 MSHA biogenesis protein MshM [Pseudoalteromonas carrageenovora]GEB69828.1 MSHA biogenesis protein MshM [Pseudoalteromonas carrageenovora]SOU39679.1 AAA family ATPase [Pseudoalteromonas carrageenovora IAM 12662]
MYLNFFNLSEMPFTLTPNTEFFCALEPHHEAMQVLTTAIDMGEGFIKVTGEVGTGKTLLCRKLLNQLEPDYIVAYLPNSYLSPEELRWAIAVELGMDVDKALDQQALTQLINHYLLDLQEDNERVVLLIDEAQCLSWETLEALRLFTNLETESEKLIQVVLFGQPELDEKLANNKVRQLRQRISFSYKLRSMTAAEVIYYINHRLQVAGFNQPPLFSNNMALKIARASRGIPRLVNILCHKVLLQAYGEGLNQITTRHIQLAIKDTEDCAKYRTGQYWSYSAVAISVFAIAAIWIWRQWL